MTNTIHSVPRELLAELQEHIDCHRDAVLWGKVCDLLSAPSPANHVEDVRAMAKAQGVVMPELELQSAADEAFRAWEKAGDRIPHAMAYMAARDGFREGAAWQARLNAAPVQQVSVPDGWKLVPVEPTLDMGWAYVDAANDASPGKRNSLNHFGYRAMLAAAPAAPAADAGMVEALDYQVLFDAIAAATSVYANGAINISVQVFRDALAAHRAKGVPSAKS